MRRYDAPVGIEDNVLALSLVDGMFVGMKLHRLVAVELRPAPRALRRWRIATSTGLEVSIVSFRGSEDVTAEPERPPSPGPMITWGRPAENEPARVMLSATQAISLGDLGGAQARVPIGATSDAETALSEAANLLAIACQAQHDVFSPRPYIYIEPESEHEREALANTGRIVLPPLRSGGSMQAPGGDRSVLFSGLLSDRPQGVALMGAALGAGHGVAKLHELMRVFESAFAAAGNRLVDPLTEFLRSYPTWQPGYTRGEVRRWIKELRDPATHADMRISKRVLFDPDVEAELDRIEQAAYDVLFNKCQWNRSNSDREQRWSFSAMTRQDGSAIISDGAVLRTYDEWDHHHAFRLNENYRIDLNSLPESWQPVDWYFRDDPTRGGICSHTETRGT
jgi:hypothetical protein